MKLAAASAAYGQVAPLHALSGKQTERSQRTVVIMFDGFGLDYLEQSDMPALRRWQRDGLYKKVTGVMPSVTNANNASICC
jgi:phosphonoacetate hydrolase